MTRPALTLVKACPVTAAVLYLPPILCAVTVAQVARGIRQLARRTR